MYGRLLLLLLRDCFKFRFQNAIPTKTRKIPNTPDKLLATMIIALSNLSVGAVSVLIGPGFVVRILPSQPPALLLQTKKCKDVFSTVKL